MLSLITSETAELQTVQVSITTLTVGRKQVTLALFRQLLEEPLIDFKSFSLRGTPWGHVRYQVEYSHEAVINVVWQLGNELRRCVVQRHWKPDFGGWEPVTPEYVRASTQYAGFKTWECYGYHQDIDPAYIKKWGDSDAERTRKDAAYQLALEEFTEFVNMKIADDNAERARRIEKYNAIVEPLFSLPQLFIAV